MQNKDAAPIQGAELAEMRRLAAEAHAVFDLMLTGCALQEFGDYQNGDGETIGPRMDALHSALRAYSATPAQPIADVSALRKVIHELRTYSPPGDRYNGVHIHPGWADKIEAAIAGVADVSAPNELTVELRRWAGESNSYSACMFRRAADQIELFAARLRSADVNAPTDLSKRLRAIAAESEGSWVQVSVTGPALLIQAADEIDRYYGGMLAWKKCAEAKDAARAAAPVSGQAASLADELKLAPFCLSPHMAYAVARHIDSRSGQAAQEQADMPVYQWLSKVAKAERGYTGSAAHHLMNYYEGEESDPPAAPTAQPLTDADIERALEQAYYPPDHPGNCLLQRAFPNELVKVVRALLGRTAGATPARGERGDA